jgi:hypothetical protein
VSPDGNQLAFIADDKLYIAHLGIHQITDFCLQVNQRQIDPQGSEIAWSPDSHYIIFAYSGYPLLINIETQAMENLDYESGIIRGWYNN